MQTLKNDVIVTSPNPSGCFNPNEQNIIAFLGLYKLTHRLTFGIIYFLKI